MMKFLTFLSAILLSFATFSQINYQAQYVDGGIPVQNANITVGIVLHDSTPTGTIVYNETHSTSTNENGIFTIVIGQGVTSIGDIDSIHWETNKFISLFINGNDLGTTQVMAVPISLHSKKSEKQCVKGVLSNSDYSIQGNIMTLNNTYSSNLMYATYTNVAQSGEITNGYFVFGPSSGGYDFLINSNDYSSRTIYVFTEDGLFKIEL